MQPEPGMPDTEELILESIGNRVRLESECLQEGVNKDDDYRPHSLKMRRRSVEIIWARMAMLPSVQGGDSLPSCLIREDDAKQVEGDILSALLQARAWCEGRLKKKWTSVMKISEWVKRFEKAGLFGETKFKELRRMNPHKWKKHGKDSCQLLRSWVLELLPSYEDPAF